MNRSIESLRRLAITLIISLFIHGQSAIADETIKQSADISQASLDVTASPTTELTELELNGSAHNTDRLYIIIAYRYKGKADFDTVTNNATNPSKLFGPVTNNKWDTRDFEGHPILRQVGTHEVFAYDYSTHKLLALGILNVHR